MLPALAHVRDWIFDLDNTLYPASTNLFAEIEARMGQYICDLLDCDIPPAALVWVSSDANDRVAAGRAERDWSLSYRHAPDPEPDLIVAATTWDEFDARWAAYTWADFDTAMSGRTWDEFDLIEWDQFA